MIAVIALDGSAGVADTEGTLVSACALIRIVAWCGIVLVHAAPQRVLAGVVSTDIAIITFERGATGAAATDADVAICADIVVGARNVQVGMLTAVDWMTGVSRAGVVVVTILGWSTHAATVCAFVTHCAHVCIVARRIVVDVKTIPRR